MASFAPQVNIACSVTMTLTEDEAKALELLSQYSPTDVCEALKSISSNMVHTHGKAMSSFLMSCGDLGLVLKRIQAARDLALKKS